MRSIWQKLLLVFIILSCGIIFSLGSAAHDTTPAKAAVAGKGGSVQTAAAAPAKRVVYYAQDRHGPW